MLRDGGPAELGPRDGVAQLRDGDGPTMREVVMALECATRRIALLEAALKFDYRQCPECESWVPAGTYVRSIHEEPNLYKLGPRVLCMGCLTALLDTLADGPPIRRTVFFRFQSGGGAMYDLAAVFDRSGEEVRKRVRAVLAACSNDDNLMRAWRRACAEVGVGVRR